MNAITPVVPVTATPESPPVAAAEARAVAPLRVSGIEAMARSRLLTVTSNSLLVEVAALLSSAQISVVVVCDAEGAPLAPSRRPFWSGAWVWVRSTSSPPVRAK